MPMNCNACVLTLVTTVLCLFGAGCHGTSAERLKAFLQKNPSQVTATEYRIMPPDVIQVSSTKILEFGGGAAVGGNAGVDQVVRPDGKVNLPLIGEIMVADRTPKEIEATINEAARKYYEQVDCTVNIVTFNSQKVYVFGQVSRPGPLPWTGTNTVLDVLAQSQPTTLAWPERIHVVRGKPPRRGGYLPDEVKKGLVRADGKSAAEASGATAGQDKATPQSADAKAVEAKAVAANGAEANAAIATKEKKDEGSAQAEVMVIDMMVMVHDGDLSRNIILEPDDVVYVPPNPLAAFGLAMQQVLLGIQPAASTIQLPASALYSVKSVQNFGGSSKQIP